MGSGSSAAKYQGDSESPAEATVVTVKPRSLHPGNGDVEPKISEDSEQALASESTAATAERTLDTGSERAWSGGAGVGGPATVHLNGAGTSVTLGVRDKQAERQGTGSASLGRDLGDKGGLHSGQRVWVHGLRSSAELNDQEALIVRWDAISGRWVVRFSTGLEKRIRAANLSSSPPASTSPGMNSAKELEQYMLHTNWSAIYQLFYERFGVEGLNRLERGYAVKAAVEMTLSIVAKCFALLRSDPHGRLHCTPLHIAALQSSMEAAEVIVRDSPKVVERTHRESPSALCPLHIAILCGSYGIVELLLDGKANPNVRTLHDVSPLHLAATTSKELCQLLLAYSAESCQHDVMGSNAVHYAATFKQHEVLEILLNTPQAPRLAAEGDQKRVTALHVSCALFSGQTDQLGPMLLLAAGAKPWQSDVSGSSARDVVPYEGGELMKFFESCGDNSKVAAQNWLEDYLLKSRDDATEESDDEDWQEGTTPTGAYEGVPTPTAAVTERGEAARLREEVERLKASLEEKDRRCEELEPLVRQLQHSQEKVQMLEQGARNQQEIFSVQMGLMDQSRAQHQAQLQELKDRHLADKQHWEERSRSELEARLRDAQQEAELKLRDSELRVAELQAEVKQAQVSQAEQMARAFSRTLSETEQANADTNTEELQAELGRLEELCNQERAAAAEACKHYQDVKSAARRISARHGIAWNEVAENPLQGIEEALGRLQSSAQLQDREAQALHLQMAQLREEADLQRAAKLETDDRCRQMQVEMQQAENQMNAKALQLESELKETLLLQSQAAESRDFEASSALKRAEEAEEKHRSLEASVETLTAQLSQLEGRFIEEQLIRKKYHNQIQDMKGTIRVFCRFRPIGKREHEKGDFQALHKADAFSVDLQRLAPHNDCRRFDFDAVFGAESCQQEVFSDCKDLVQSALDGYNVTIFAYGQTGAGKTHTMYGSNDNPGLAPRSIDSLFHLIRQEESQGRKKFSVKAYMIELYKQDILDLLAEKKDPKEQKPLQVKKDAGRGIMFVEGVSERKIEGPEQLKAVLAEGERRRHTAATAMNSSSSRSHLLLSIIIEATAKDTDQVIYGKITLCDLAGSERPKKSEVSGEALKEAIEINKSLSALGDVIEALSKGSKSIPYRNHKLTMLMQDSLGGSAKTLMFVNCSPASSNCEETMMSLKWATRAKQVTNDVKRNADSKEVARLKQVIALMSQAQSVEEPLAKGGGLAS